MDKFRPVLIADISARGLTQAARRSGFSPYAVDFFADEDLRAIAAGWRKLSGPFEDGFQLDDLLVALSELVSEIGDDQVPLVTGAGFEGTPSLLDALAERFALVGNSAEAVRAVNSPEVFFGGLAKAGISFPPYQLDKPIRAEDWLFKKSGGAGGEHILPAISALGDSLLGYFQKFVVGDPVSVLLLADGHGESRVIGFSDQWVTPSTTAPMRWGGAIRPSIVSSSVLSELANTSDEIARLFGLRGLNSVDFLVDGAHFYVLEVNPRPGATIDLFDQGALTLFQLHVEACAGALPGILPKLSGTCASAVLFADEDVVIPPNMVWPAWVADRPVVGEVISKDAPICTIIAHTDEFGVTKKLVSDYSQRISYALGTA